MELLNTEPIKDAFKNDRVADEEVIESIKAFTEQRWPEKIQPSKLDDVIESSHFAVAMLMREVLQIPQRIRFLQAEIEEIFGRNATKIKEQKRREMLALFNSLNPYTDIVVKIRARLNGRIDDDLVGSINSSIHTLSSVRDKNRWDYKKCDFRELGIPANIAYILSKIYILATRSLVAKKDAITIIESVTSVIRIYDEKYVAPEKHLNFYQVLEAFYDGLLHNTKSILDVMATFSQQTNDRLEQDLDSRLFFSKLIQDLHNTVCKGR